MVEKKDQLLELKSLELTLKNRIILTLCSGIFTGFFVFLVFLILESDDWYLITGGFLPNILLLFALGSLFGYYYYRFDAKRFKETHLVFKDSHVSVISKDITLRTYPKRIFVKTRVDTQFYFLIGMRKITIQFIPIKGRRFQIECLLVKKDDVTQILKEIEDAMNETKR